MISALILIVTFYCFVAIAVGGYYFISADPIGMIFARGIFWGPLLIRDIFRSIVEIWREE